MGKQKIIEIEADSLEEARKKIESRIPKGLSVLSENVISDGKPKTIKVIADTKEAAFTNAQKEIPANAKIIDKKELYIPKHKIITIEAFDEQSAKALIERQTGNTAKIKSFKLKTSGKKGVLRIGKKPNEYEAEIFQQSVVEITYRTKAKISTIIGEKKKTVMTILRQIIIESGEDDDLAEMNLRLIELLKGICNSNFSMESIKEARQFQDSRIQKYVEKFLCEVEENLDYNGSSATTTLLEEEKFQLMREKFQKELAQLASK